MILGVCRSWLQGTDSVPFRETWNATEGVPYNRHLKIVQSYLAGKRSATNFGMEDRAGQENILAQHVRNCKGYSAQPCLSRTAIMAFKMLSQVRRSIITSLGNMQPSQQMCRIRLVSSPRSSRSQ